MSSVRHAEYTCAVCHLTSRYTILTSTNTFGSPDLDLRPPEMKRSTMCYWVQECPGCGYASTEISEPTIITPDFLKSDAYVSCDGHTFRSELAKRFYHQYLILNHIRDYQSAFYALVHAAWSCDDANDRKLSVKCRSLAVALAENNRLLDQGVPDFQIMLADLMRRSRQFKKVVDKYNDVDLKNDLLNSLLRFEVKASKNRDIAAYTVQQAMTKKYGFNLFRFNRSDG